MSSKGGYTAAPPRQGGGGGGDRFYNAPMVRRHQQLLQQQLIQRQLLQQQQQHQRQLQQQQLQQQQRQQHMRPAAASFKGESSSSAAAADTDAEKQTDAGESSSMAVALPLRPSVAPAPSTGVTNLDRLMESVTPFIEARYFPEVNTVGPTTGTSGVESRAFFYLEDLWVSFSEWSVYGAGVPLLLNGRDPIEQYYVPFLSGIQLYVDPSGPSSHLQLKRGGGAVVFDSPGKPLYEFMEIDQPYNRRPLTDRASLLTSYNPDLGKFRSCDLLPTSWFSVAWYPIYRIPVGPTLQDLEASFLTFHPLSTQSSSSYPPPQLHAANTRTVRGFADPTARISLPVFALASYKLAGSILSPSALHECQQENSLLQAADNWLTGLKAALPDYHFFRTHGPYRR